MYSVVFNDFVTQSVQNCLLCSLLDETGKFIRLLSNFCTFQNMKGVNGESIFCPPIQKAFTCEILGSQFFSVWSNIDLEFE